ncbi:MAG: SMC-Scp complex subunit ScpB [Ignavibacteriae bacterium]|nr:SMC-Scp complex subunit ScpB [Ignavibacteriota bacterium]
MRSGGTLTIREIIEALLYASDEPLSVKQMLDIFEMVEPGELPQKVDQDVLLQTIEQLNREYDETSRSLHIVKIAGGYQFATRPQFATWLGRMMSERAKRKLSVSALESLAVIAYKQPVTKPEIEAIRGVNADYVLRTLLERNLIAIIGRAATPGRPLLYGTTKEFLKHFGLNDLSELPRPREIDELLAEAEFEVEKQMLKELEAKKASEESDVDGNIVVSEDGTLRKLDDDSPPDADDLSNRPQ